MIFTRIEYVLFFGLVFGLHALAPRRSRVGILFVASLAFYGSWNYRYLGLILGSTVLSYVAARRCEFLRADRARTAWAVTAIVGNLAVLGIFKYAGFFTDNVAALLRAFGFAPDFPTLKFLLPVGISFYTFQAISYVVDVWAGETKAERSFVRFATYLAFFPQLVAGPIVRASELLPQLAAGSQMSTHRFRRGARLFIWGAVKKTIFADIVALKFVDAVFDAPGQFDCATLWLASLGFALQVYADFSGYTDMARGSALMLGYDLPKNFDLPYLSKSFTEFWNRWHITLGTWLRDYVFYPIEIRNQRRLAARSKALGAQRTRRLALWRTMGTLLLVFLLCGLWHGAAWHFIVFGAIHGVAVAAHFWWTHRFAGSTWAARRAHPVYAGAMVSVTFVALILTFVVFRAENLTDAGHCFRTMFGGGGGERRLHIAPLVLIPTFAIGTILAGRFDLEQVYSRTPWPVRSLTYVGLVVALSILSPQTNLAFVYFQF